MVKAGDGSRGDAARLAGAWASAGMREVAPLPILSLGDLTKTYRNPMTLKPFTAVDGLSLTLERGEIFGLLGPNGAGKTSTIKMILGLTKPTRGSVLLDGRDPRDPRARKRLGYLPENACFYDHVTAVEFLELSGALFGIQAGACRRRADALLSRLGLSEHAGKPLRKFSKGLTQRLGICQALLNEPNFLVLDEPMSGLDPIGRAEVKEILREERKRGTTIFMSSHVLAETEPLCDRIGILHHGRLIDVGAVRTLLSSGVLEWEITADALGEDRAKTLRSCGHHVESVGSRWVIRVRDSAALQTVLRELTQGSAIIHSVEPRRQSLEEYFVAALKSGDRGRG